MHLNVQYKNLNMNPLLFTGSKNRRNDQDQFSKRLPDVFKSDINTGGKPSLQSRLKRGNNLQVCFVNESDDDTELYTSPNDYHSNEKKLSKPQSNISSKIYKNKTSSNNLILPLNHVHTTHNKVVSVEDFFVRQAELQAEAKKALSESKEYARRLMQEEHETHPVSPITEFLRITLQKVGVTFPKGKRRLSRQMCTNMNVTQLQVIVNELHTQIEFLNEKLVRYLMERDELHMSQDSMLVDIEDLTRYLTAKQKP